jgi:hypothetical protein
MFARNADELGCEMCMRIIQCCRAPLASTPRGLR